MTSSVTYSNYLYCQQSPYLENLFDYFIDFESLQVTFGVLFLCDDYIFFSVNKVGCLY